MADTAVAITAGTGTNIDTRTEATNGNHRQVIVIGDPATNAGVAPVDVTTGLVVNIAPGIDKGSGTGGSLTPRVILDSSQLDPTVAHDAVDSGSPYKQGGRAVAGMSGITLVAAADRTDSLHGIDGAQYVRPHCGLEDIVSGVAAITDGSSTSVIASAGGGVKNYITTAIISNTSATAVTVDLRDGAAGTVKATLPVPANTSGVVCNLPVPLPFSAATAVCADPSAAASTVTVTLIGFKSKV
jgi:hypothetical protein